MFVWPTSHIGMLHPAGGEKARAIMRSFLAYAEAADAGISYNDAKPLLNVSTNQAETRKSFFEEMALLYVPYRSDQIILTPLGRQLYGLLGGADLSQLSATDIRQATSIIVWAMCKAQINRPQSRGVPRLSENEWKQCDIRPYATAWTAINELDGELHIHEFMGALRRLQSVGDYRSVIDKIAFARLSGEQLATENEISGKSEMNYRIYWRSHLSVADKVLNWDSSNSVCWVNSDNWDIVAAALRFLQGCAGDPIRSIRAESWSTVEEYFLEVAGGECPPFLAGGQPTISNFDGQPLANLDQYSIMKSGGYLTVHGGPELCHLQLQMPCFHPDSPTRLLRLDRKQQNAGGAIELRLALARPIISLAQLQKALEGKP